jgi:transcriptional regulator with PAS, ATPase and Fis domain
MKKVLFSWIGKKNDLTAAKTNGARGMGAICQALSDRHFDELVLLSDFSERDSTGYVEWLEEKKLTNIKLAMVDIGENPTDFRAIYEAARHQVNDYLDMSTSEIQLTFLITSGTSAMSTIWIILASSQYNAKLLQTSIQQGVEDIEFPFEITADYIHKSKENAISALFSHSVIPPGFEGIIHKSQVMKTLLERTALIAPYQSASVLVLGESGTGKELLANAIHNLSKCTGNFVPVNCGAIPENLFEAELFGTIKGSATDVTTKPGYIEQANDGTLFLDEIGEMPLVCQTKLLRVLQEKRFCRVGETTERRVDFRVVAATNRNLVNEISAGGFREDLFHRLSVGILNIPPLRERKEDICHLVDYLLKCANTEYGKHAAYQPKKITDTAKAYLATHEWPGNIRELENTIKRAAVWTQANTIDKQAIKDVMIAMPSAAVHGQDALNRPLDDGLDLDSLLDEVALHYIERALKLSGGNITKASELIGFKGCERLRKWIKKFNM